MNTINSNYNVNYFSNSVNNINSADNNNVSLNENPKETNNKDSIEISQNNENIINKKKALDAFNDTIGKNNYAAYYYSMLADSMKDFGYNVPDFTSDGSNNSKFLPFIDNMKSFVNDLFSGKIPFSQYGAAPLTTDFLDFCDSFKERLIQYDCK